MGKIRAATKLRDSPLLRLVMDIKFTELGLRPELVEGIKRLG